MGDAFSVPFILSCLYSNKNKPPEELNRMGIDDECRIIAGGGFNGNAFTPPSTLNESSYFFVSKM